VRLQLVSLRLRVAQLTSVLELLRGCVDRDRPDAVLRLHHQGRLHGAVDHLLDNTVVDRVEAVDVVLRVV
jgi:hypothetical protein